MSDARTLLIVDDDEHVNLALSASFADAGRVVISCRDVETAELALQRYAVTDVLTDVQFSSELGFEGIGLLDRVQALRPHARIVVMTGHVSKLVRAAAMAHGAAAFLEKPFNTREALAAFGGPLEAAEARLPGSVITIPAIETFTREQASRPLFQPIVFLRDEQKVFGFEALARFDVPWPFGAVGTVFEYAARKDRLAEINARCIETALGAARALPPESRLFLNIDPPALVTDAVLSTLVSAASRASIEMHRLVIELTETFPFPDPHEAAAAIESLHRAGVAFALDDAGISFSHLPMLESIRPSFVKISNRFGSGFEKDATKRRLVSSMVAVANELGCAVVLEGIETASTLDAARALGLQYGQGYLFSPPVAAHDAAEIFSRSSAARTASKG